MTLRVVSDLAGKAARVTLLVLDKNAAKPSMSVDQLSSCVENTVENVRCQYDDVCNDGEMSVNKYVCMECSVQSTECGCEGSDARSRPIRRPD